MGLAVGCGWLFLHYHVVAELSALEIDAAGGLSPGRWRATGLPRSMLMDKVV